MVLKWINDVLPSVFLILLVSAKPTPAERKASNWGFLSLTMHMRLLVTSSPSFPFLTTPRLLLVGSLTCSPCGKSTAGRPMLNNAPTNWCAIRMESTHINRIKCWRNVLHAVGALPVVISVGCLQFSLPWKRRSSSVVGSKIDEHVGLLLLTKYSEERVTSRCTVSRWGYFKVQHTSLLYIVRVHNMHHQPGCTWFIFLPLHWKACTTSQCTLCTTVLRWFSPQKCWNQLVFRPHNVAGSIQMLAVYS